MAVEDIQGSERLHFQNAAEGTTWLHLHYRTIVFEGEIRL